MYDDLLNISEAAKMLGLSPSTLRRLEKDGYVEGYGLRVIYTPGGQRRYALDEVQKLYTNNGFSGELGVGSKPALLIRDLTNAFTMPYSQLVCQLDNQIEVVSKLIDLATQLRVPVIFSITVYDPQIKASELWGKKFPNIQLLDSNSNWVQIHQDLSQKKYDFVNKLVYISDFHSELFRDFLKAQEIDTLIIAGTTTSGSIRATAVDALQYGYNVVIPREAVADRSNAIQNVTLMDLNARYADVVSVDKVFHYLKETDK
ncbi:isochorismatase family protein [Halalkalibacter oceani]|uniref:isochorismatase family protein n=1 Tax=Halalkalibacter oceani TaxID=1653776 RepID=UPI0033939DFF